MESVLLEALEVESHHATGHYLLGTALQHQKKYTQAWSAREKALLLDLSRKRSLPIYATIADEVCTIPLCATVNIYPIIKQEVSTNGLDIFRTLYGDHEHLNPDGISFVANQFTPMIVKTLSKNTSQQK